MSVEIKGLKEIIDKLNTLPPKLENKVVRSAVRKGTNKLRDSARDKVAVDTGNLKKSIVTMGYRESGKIAFKVAVIRRKAKSAKSPYYAHFVEFGTSKMPAQPYMRPALDESEEEVLQTTVDYIKKGLSEL